MVSRGYFITFEGGEGAGKTSQIKRLEKKLTSNGRTVLVTREPGGSIGAEAVRYVLLSGAAEPFGAEMEALLFASARSDHVETVIEPALSEGVTVISDRFFDSSRVYQGESGKVNPFLLKRLERIACNGTLPDLTLILDVDPQEGMKRATKRRKKGEDPDRYEKESLKHQTERREAFLKIAKSEPERCVVIDGTGTEAAVFKEVWNVVENRLLKPAANRAQPFTKNKKTGSRIKEAVNAAKRRSKPDASQKSENKPYSSLQDKLLNLSNKLNEKASENASERDGVK